MSQKTQVRRFSQRTIRQVRLDARRALIRAHFCPDRSQVLQLRCVEDRPEDEHDFGLQLWYFEGVAVDEVDRRHHVFGAMEYSIQFGLNEVSEDGVFSSEYQRSRMRDRLHGDGSLPRLGHPAHRYLALGMVAVAILYLVYLGFRLGFLGIGGGPGV
ncbi:MAG: hypothetical protein AAF958_06975 [Planctomycetota bacterium]